MLHLARNPPADADDWIGFTSWRQLDKCPFLFRPGEVEAALAQGDVLAWHRIEFRISLADQAELYHPGLMAFLARLYRDLGLGDVGVYARTRVGIFASYWAMRKADFAEHMRWLEPALLCCLRQRTRDPFLGSHPRATGYALERLFTDWCLRTGKRVVDRTRLPPTAPPPGPADEALVREAHRLYQAGDRAAAERLCRQRLDRPNCPAAAVYLLGALADEAGRTAEAAALCSQAALLDPHNAVYVNALGEAALLLGHRDQAAAAFRQAVALRPNYARAHNNLGRLAHAAGDPAAAAGHFAEAVRLNPAYATAHNNLGAALQAQGRLEAAADHFRRALALTPNYPEAHFNLGAALQAQGDPAAATAHLTEAVRLRPGYARAIFHLGQAQEALRHDLNALACYEAAARLRPDDPEVQRRLGDLLLLKKDWPAALAALDRAVALSPDAPEALARRAWARQLACDWRDHAADADRLWTQAAARIAAGEPAGVGPFQALTLPWPRPRLLAVARAACAALARRHRGPRPDLPHPVARAPGGRLRVGYLSGDFYDHAVSHLLHGLFERHDRARVEVFAYSFGPPDDSPFRRRIQAGCEHFVEAADLPVPDLARRIAADGIHVLVDLMGHTGVHRLPVLALRPAPVQVSFLGMLGTTGADFIDYLISDPVVAPPAFAPDFTEQFATLPDCYLVAEPDPAPPPAAAGRRAHGLPEDAFVYASFNNSYKIDPSTFALWMRILARVPRSVLWLYSPGALVEDNLRREAAARGVDPGRLVFAPALSRPEHYRRHAAADLFLDTLLYNAAATAALALQAGLPVLTCPGDTFASRAGASLLHAAGLPELVAADPAAYEEAAIRLAARPDDCRALRARLLATRTTAPLFDTARFARHLEAAYDLMWDRHAAGRSPAPLTVPPV